MTETIDEPVSVIASFHRGTVMPRKFEWRGRTYQPTKLGLVHKTQRGDAVMVHYGVADETSGYELVFNTLTLQWRLRSIFAGA
jgi:hypothetical protein